MGLYVPSPSFLQTPTDTPADADDYACLQRDLEGNYRSSPDELMDHEVQQQHGSDTTEGAATSFEGETKQEKPAAEAVVV